MSSATGEKSETTPLLLQPADPPPLKNLCETFLQERDQRSPELSAVCTLRNSDSSVWTISSQCVSSAEIQEHTPTTDSDPSMKLHRISERSSRISAALSGETEAL
ncbi:hypothetical protein F7725_016394 [Dissostichus mawsoni]|uniref:Uncharacterized protein n=1 Tax=Dissostichus mawsoni TaxID=36200 RepID=A0A7J5Z3G6_DISMA|nr:hypothetical protein F7725_016394 [Dissostichus mawsoni]